MAKSSLPLNTGKYSRILAKVIAKLLLRFDFKYKNFTNHLKKECVIEAKKQHLRYTNIQLSIRTGIDRRFISEYLKSNDINFSEWPEKDLIVMRHLMQFCKKHHTDRIRKGNGPNSFDSICSECISDIKMIGAIATELERKRWIIDNGHYYIINDKYLDSWTESKIKQLNTITKNFINQYEEQ